MPRDCERRGHHAQEQGRHRTQQAAQQGKGRSGDEPARGSREADIGNDDAAERGGKAQGEGGTAGRELRPEGNAHPHRRCARTGYLMPDQQRRQQYRGDHRRDRHRQARPGNCQ